MEYLRGLPLSEVLRELGTRPPEASPQRFMFAAQLLSQVCEGLHAAHELRDADGKLLQVVHRDVSPHNLFVTFDGTIRVLDFGIARAVDRLSESTTGRVKGKFAYMAPEQALGREVDRRSDVFSVGVVLWELCTLERLFKRDSPAETVLNVVNEEPPPPASVAPDVPPELERICMKALAKDPAERYQSARQMGRALARAAAAIGPPVTAGDVSDWMGRLFPGEPEQQKQILESHTLDSDQEGDEVTGWRAKITPLSMPTRRRRRGGVPALVAILLVVVAAVSAFVVARITQPDTPRAMLPSDRIPEPRLDEPVAVEPEVVEPEADLVFDAPVDLLEPDVEPEPEVEPEAADPEPEIEVEAEAEPPRVARRRRARRRRATTTTPARETGRVRVGAPFDAMLYDGNRRLGDGPGIYTLPVGRRTIEMRRPGQDPVRRTVEVEENSEARVVFR